MKFNFLEKELLKSALRMYRFYIYEYSHMMEMNYKEIAIEKMNLSTIEECIKKIEKSQLNQEG